MKKNKNKKETYVSMIEFEKKFFPKSFEKRMKERITDARAIGINSAKESLDKIREHLAES
ncbi:MAG: hypothetical protein CVT88_08720 [Candidatus Altiarchaeales archaeon HGW-Altiarchaeales-1]|nr:MAG: hypothetical protein CVT88_08720 [Candidatus Altiarchaeales archaeon HGW-Altiarchaeales-1]